MFGHSCLYFDLMLILVAKYFVPLGFLVYSFEYRHHSPPILRSNGASILHIQQKEQNTGHINSWKELRHDIHKFIYYITPPDSKVYLYGRSAGCLVVLDYMLQHPATQSLIHGKYSKISIY